MRQNELYLYVKKFYYLHSEISTKRVEFHLYFELILTHTNNPFDKMSAFDGVVEVYDIFYSGSGRSCDAHTCCGMELVYNDVLRVEKREIPNKHGQMEMAIAALRDTGRTRPCCVGF
jgi:hypothetical protein